MIIKNRGKCGMAKRIICLGILFILIFSFAACANQDKKILKQFDLSDPKEYWKGTVDDDFADDVVLIVMRKTKTYPELELRHFKLENAESVEYIALSPPNNGDYSNGEAYHQIAVIKLKEHGKDKVVEAIKHLEKLKFIKSASPNGFYTPDIQMPG